MSGAWLSNVAVFWYEPGDDWKKTWVYNPTSTEIPPFLSGQTEYGPCEVALGASDSKLIIRIPPGFFVGRTRWLNELVGATRDRRARNAVTDTKLAEATIWFLRKFLIQEWRWSDEDVERAMRLRPELRERFLASQMSQARYQDEEDRWACRQRRACVEGFFASASRGRESFHTVALLCMAMGLIPWITKVAIGTGEITQDGKPELDDEGRPQPAGSRQFAEMSRLWGPVVYLVADILRIRIEDCGFHKSYNHDRAQPVTPAGPEPRLSERERIRIFPEMPPSAADCGLDTRTKHAKDMDECHCPYDVRRANLPTTYWLERVLRPVLVRPNDPVGFPAEQPPPPELIERRRERAATPRGRRAASSSPTHNVVFRSRGDANRRGRLGRDASPALRERNQRSVTPARVFDAALAISGTTDDPMRSEDLDNMFRGIEDMPGTVRWFGDFSRGNRGAGLRCLTALKEVALNFVDLPANTPLTVVDTIVRGDAQHAPEQYEDPQYASQGYELAHSSVPQPLPEGSRLHVLLQLLSSLVVLGEGNERLKNLIVISMAKEGVFDLSWHRRPKGSAHWLGLMITFFTSVF